MFHLLTIDVAQIIWSHLETSDYVNLHATLNKPLQNLLHKRGLVLNLPSYVDMVGPRRYFALLARDVSDLTFKVSQNISAQDEALLKRLNPLHLTIAILEAQAKARPDRNEPGTRYLPNLPDCTTRLQSLQLADSVLNYFPNHIQDAPLLPLLTFPSTLTKFRGRLLASQYDDVIQALPPSLTDLGLFFAHDMVRIRLSVPFTRFKSLASLDFFGAPFTLLDDEFEFPPNLTQLRLRGLHSFPIKLLQHPWKAGGLAELDLLTSLSVEQTSESLPIALDLARILPSSLERMTIRLSRTSPSTQTPGIVTLPIGLTDLKLEGTASHAVAIDAFMALRNLTSLSLERPRSLGPHLWNFETMAKFPKSLTVLRIGGPTIHPLLPAQFKELPPNLTRLKIPTCRLDHALELRNVLPKATMTFLYNVELWGATLGPELLKQFSDLVAPEFDLITFRTAAQRHYLAKGVSFDISFEVDPDSDPGEPLKDTTSLIYKLSSDDDDAFGLFSDPFPTLNHLYMKFPSITKLVIHLPTKSKRTAVNKAIFLPPLLTYIDLSNVHLAGESFPGLAHLEYLASDCELSIVEPPQLQTFLSLTHLDTPLWVFQVSETDLSERKPFTARRHLLPKPPPAADPDDIFSMQK